MTEEYKITEFEGRKEICIFDFDYQNEYYTKFNDVDFFIFTKYEHLYSVIKETKDAREISLALQKAYKENEEVIIWYGDQNTGHCDMFTGKPMQMNKIRGDLLVSQGKYPLLLVQQKGSKYPENIKFDAIVRIDSEEKTLYKNKNFSVSTTWKKD